VTAGGRGELRAPTFVVLRGLVPTGPLIYGPQWVDNVGGRLQILVDAEHAAEIEADTKRCTDEGITVVALDSRARRLQRARPERVSDRVKWSMPAGRRWGPVLLLVAAVVALVLVRFS